MGTLSRKDFLRLSGLASASLMIPNFLKATNLQTGTLLNPYLASATNGKILVVIQFSGGNDGLNMVIPHGDDLYYTNRPAIGLKEKDIITLDQHFAFNGVMKGMADLYNDGQVAIVNSVGYPNPNRSHFRSMDIWQSASGSNEYLSTGWVGRYLDAACSGTAIKPHLALEVDDILSMAMKGKVTNGIAANSLQRLYGLGKDELVRQTAKSWTSHDDDEHNVEYLHKTLAETVQSADYLHDHSAKYRSKRDYPQNTFGKQLKLIAELIRSGSETTIYYVSLPGFDTHVGQVNQQNRLLRTYSEALEAFSQDLKEGEHWNDTLVMTFSEFGRRVKQNAGQGTDHGTANVLLLAGGGLKRKGIINGAPDLKNLDNGDLIYKVDFRQVYATVLNNWLKTDAEKILGSKFSMLDMV